MVKVSSILLVTLLATATSVSAVSLRANVGRRDFLEGTTTDIWFRKRRSVRAAGGSSESPARPDALPTYVVATNAMCMSTCNSCEDGISFGCCGCGGLAGCGGVCDGGRNCE